MVKIIVVSMICAGVVSKMITITERVLGKPIESINKNDLNILIGQTESLELEFKEIDERMRSNDDRKEKILQPLVSFLNSSLGSGLLILGVKEGKRDVAENIVAVNPKILSQLSTEGSLEMFIYDKINSIPSEIRKFELKVRSIHWHGDKNVYLIEIKRNDSYCVYSSGVTARVYVREGRKSPGLSFNHAIDLLSKKNYPRPYVDVELLSENKQGDKFFSAFGFSFVNKGTKPASNISIVYLIGSEVNLEIVQKPQYGFDIEDLDLKKFDLQSFENYEFRVAFNHLHKNRHPINDLPIYPSKKFSAGVFSLGYADKIEFRIFSLIFEQNAFTKQEFQIYKESGKKAQIVEDIKRREFHPYMTLY